MLDELNADSQAFGPDNLTIQCVSFVYLFEINNDANNFTGSRCVVRI